MFFAAHRDRLDAAVQACSTRGYWSPFLESPSGKLHPDGAKKAGLEAFQSALGADFPLEFAFAEIRRDGQKVFVGIARDITERKRVERMTKEFISTINHELRTPLTSIQG